MRFPFLLCIIMWQTTPKSTDMALWFHHLSGPSAGLSGLYKCLGHLSVDYLADWISLIAPS